MNQKEIEEANLLKQKEKTLGWGEIESIILAKNKGFLLLSNDKKALKIASGLKIDCFNLPMILRQLWKQSVISKESVLQTITEIETKDRIILLNKGRIFKP